jgi:quinol monooxygenase YgiN
MSATLAVRHTVADYGNWLVAYKGAEATRDKHGCTAEQVYRRPDDGNDIFLTHDFPTVAQAEAFVADPDLRAAMQSGGVNSAPRIEIFERA